MAAGIPSIRTDLGSNNIASLFGKTRREEMSVRTTIPEGRVLATRGNNRASDHFALISSVFREALDESYWQIHNIPKKRCLKWLMRG